MTIGWIIEKIRFIFDIASIYQNSLNKKELAIEYYQKIPELKYYTRKDYYKYAQQEITKLKEELFFEGKLEKPASQIETGL